MSKQNKKQAPNPFAAKQATNNKKNSSAASSSGSRFGGSSSGSSRFAGRFGSRNSREDVHWTVAPMAKEVVGISLTGLGDPFHRLLDMPLNRDFSDPKQVADALSQDEDLFAHLTAVLDETWANFNFRGAAMLYPWDTDIRKAFTQPLQPTAPPPKKEENDNDDNDDDVYYDDDSLPEWLEKPTAHQSAHCLRAIDMAFVLNILARVRSNIVVGNTPLALEASFLTQTFICDDPRIVELARATGCIEEVWT
jgi:hypothetical protein